MSPTGRNPVACQWGHVGAMSRPQTGTFWGPFTVPARSRRCLFLFFVALCVGCAPPVVQTKLTSINLYRPPAEPAKYLADHRAPVRVGLAQRMVYGGQGTRPGDVWLTQADQALAGFANYAKPGFVEVVDPVSLRKRPDYLVELGVRVTVKGSSGVRTVESEMVMNLFDRYHSKLLLVPRPFSVARIAYNPKSDAEQWLDKEDNNVFHRLFHLQFMEMAQRIQQYHRAHGRAPATQGSAG